MLRKTNGRTFHNNAVTIALLGWCLCSSIVVCIGTSSRTPTQSTISISTTGITNNPTTGITNAPTTGITNAPTTGITNAPTTGITNAPTTGITNAPTTGITNAPTTGITNAPTTDITNTPTTDITNTPATDITSTPTTEITSTPTTDNPSAKVTTSPAKSDRPSYFPMPTANGNTTLKLQVKLDSRNFRESLKNSSSPDYQELETNVTNELIPIFNKSRGFINIAVTGFWNGSIGVNFTSFYQDINFTDVIIQLNSSLHNLPKDFNGTLLQQTFNESINNELKSICDTSDSCPRDYRCSVNNTKLQLYCKHLCHEYRCQSNSAYCVVSESNQPACKCGEDDDYVYSGEHCETKTEKLTMSKDKIIGIAAGVGGGVILILLLAICIILLRQRQQKRSRGENIIDNASEQSFQSFKGTEDAIHQPASNSEYITSDGRGQSLYRLPEERAENPKFNPYLSLPNVQQPATRQQDFSQGFLQAPERTRGSSRNIQAKTQQFHERVPNYGDPVHIPRFQVDLHGSDYTGTDNKRAQASGTAHPLNDTDLYDFSYENQLNDDARRRSNRQHYDSPYQRNGKQTDEINDPYSVQRRLV